MSSLDICLKDDKEKNEITERLRLNQDKIYSYPFKNVLGKQRREKIVKLTGVKESLLSCEE